MTATATMNDQYTAHTDRVTDDGSRSVRES